MNDTLTTLTRQLAEATNQPDATVYAFEVNDGEIILTAHIPGHPTLQATAPTLTTCLAILIDLANDRLAVLPLDLP